MLKNKRQRIIYQALLDLGGRATLWAIAEQAGLNTNGVSQTLGVMEDVYPCLPFWDGGLQEWMAKTPVK